jgi:hypothetical protein
MVIFILSAIKKRALLFHKCQDMVVLIMLKVLYLCVYVRVLRKDAIAFSF